MKTLFLSALIILACGAHAQTITTIAGTGNNGYNGDNILATSADLSGPYAVALDGVGNLYITDGYNNRIRKVDASGIITTIAGTGINGYNGDGIAATAAQLYRPIGIICDHSGNIFFADAFNHRVRKINAAGIITTVAGNGTGGYNGDNIAAISAQINNPHSVALDGAGNLYITDWDNHRIRKVNASGIITTIAGTGIVGYTGDNGPADTARINAPYGIAVNNTGDIYFVDANENVVRKINTSGIITTFAGGATSVSIGDNGPATSANLSGPGFVSVDEDGNIYIGDVAHQRIRKILATTNIITSIAGNGVQGYSGDNGPATSAKLSQPGGMAIDATGILYFADFSNHRIRRVGWALSTNTLLTPQQTITVYPNPSHGIFTVNIQSVISEQTLVLITNSIGEKVKEASSFTNTPLCIQLSQPPGLYYLSVITSQGVISRAINIVK